MKAGAILALIALPLLAQPRLLTNAKLDARSSAAGLEREFRALLAEEPARMDRLGGPFGPLI